jgi:hypothetical protein
VQNSPARLPDVGLGPRVGLPGRRQPAGYGTSWSVLVSSTSGRSGSSQPDLFHHFPSTNLNCIALQYWMTIRASLRCSNDGLLITFPS